MMSRRILPLSFLVFVLATVMSGCHNERKVDIVGKLHPETMPTMSTKDISTLISDSGITQYKVVSHHWYVFNEVDTPYWLFPKGLYLEKFDKKFKVIATVAADSAIYMVRQKLWKLIGNVEIHKAPADLFLSQRLFWNERERKIYSDTFIHIENATHTLEGTGFVSNDQMTAYRILHPNGIFPVDRSSLSGPAPASSVPGTPVAPRGTAIANAAGVPSPASASSSNQ